MTVGAAAEGEIRERFRARGLSYTSARRAVLAAVGEGDHPSADEVHLAARAEHPRLALGTVYAALEALERVGLVASRRFPGSPARFDANLEPHVEVRCARCGAIEEVEAGEVASAFEERVREASSYEGVVVLPLAEGVCRACVGEAGGKGAAGCSRSI